MGVPNFGALRIWFALHAKIENVEFVGLEFTSVFADHVQIQIVLIVHETIQFVNHVNMVMESIFLVDVHHVQLIVWIVVAMAHFALNVRLDMD